MNEDSTTKSRIVRQLSSDCNSIELNNGKATSLLGLADNYISTSTYLSNDIFMRPLFKMLNLCPISLVISILVAVTINNSEPYTRWMYGTQLFLIFLTKIAKEFYFDKIRSQADQMINNRKFQLQESKVYRDGEQLSDITWGQIKEGDILYLQKGEKAPADLLVLDTQNIEDRQALVYVDQRTITGKVTVQRKKACYLTQVTSRSPIKRIWEKYRKQYLTGKLKYQLPNPNMEEFSGYLKLVKDPKTSQITFQNFISRESIIKSCWIYAVVVNAGMNCKIMRHISQRNRNHKFFQNKVDRIFLACLLINIIIGIPFALVQISKGGDILRAFAYHFMEFSIILPHFLFLGNGLLLLYFSLKTNIDAEIMNYSNIINLGCIDYAVMAYNGVLSSGKMHPDQIITSSSLYDFRQENEVVTRGSRRNGSHMKNTANKRGNRTLMSICNSAIGDMNSINSPAPLNKGHAEFDHYFLDDQTKPDMNLRMTTGLNGGNSANGKVSLEPLRITKQKLKKNVENAEQQAMGLIVAFGLCHQAILKSMDTTDTKFQANSKVYSQQVLLRLVNSVGIHVSCQIDSRIKKEKAIRIKIIEDQNSNKNQEFEKYKEKELFYSRKQNNFQIERKIFSVVTRKDGSQERVIYCKGSPQDMLQKLKDREVRKNLIENQLAKFKQNKSEIIIYGKRTMQSAEYQIYQNQYTKLKISNNITTKDLEDFSTKFQRDLEFVCMVGLCSEKNQCVQDIVDYIWEKGIKICVFTNNIAQVNSLKSLLKQQKRDQKKDEALQYIQLQGRSVQQITYNLNSITRKLNYQRQYSYSLVLGRQCWKFLNIHSYLMQHFLFALYYSRNIIAYGFNPLEKAQLAQKIKIGFNRQQTLMSVGSSYSDLYFQNFSDVSLIISSCEGQKTHSDIPSDIRALNISALKKIIQLGSWVTSAYNYLLGVSIYRSALIGTVAFVLQTIVAAYQGTSYNLDSRLVFLYVVVYGALQTIFVIKLQYKKHKQVLECNDYCIKDKRTTIKFWANVIQGLIHGTTIGVVVLMTLPNARLSGGKIFPVEAIHFSIYLLMISVSIFRHLINGECKKIHVFILAAVSYPILLGLPWLIVVFRPLFIRFSLMMGAIWLSYDSVLMLINAFVFCLSCSLFITWIKQKGIISVLLEHFLKLQKQNAKQSKQLLNKDINHIQLVKHLFKEEQNIEDSIQEILGTQFDTNQLKIDTFLQFKKTEHTIKNQFNNTALNLKRFKITIVIVVSLFIVEVMHGLISNNKLNPWKYQLPLYASICILTLVFIWYMYTGEEIGRKYYPATKLCIFVICLTINIYELTSKTYEQHLLLTCVMFVILTQLIGIHLFIILTFVVISFIIGLFSVIHETFDNYNQRVPFYIVYFALCGIINSAVLYSSTFDSRKNFIQRQQIEMQTNQTNDIWTILVPEFVRNFFAQNGEYKQKSVAILFCYVCNFNAIIEEEGRNVVRLLDNLYREFDQVCSSFAVQKIETVGYTYMAASGIKKIENQMDNQMVRRNKVERLVSMAQQMIQKTKMFKWGVKKNKDLQIKIGIHVGEVVVGVIGKHKKQFSLIGTNVNTTSRHGSTGDQGSIVLSREAKSQLLHFPAEAFQQKLVYMKGLCKNEDQKIPVYSFKATELGKRANISSIFKQKFKKLVMKVIKQQRFQNQSSQEDETSHAFNMQAQDQHPKFSMKNSLRQLNQRSTCKGLEINFNKIEEMKKRQDETKCYSSLLQFNVEQAKMYYEEIYPTISNEQLQRLILRQTEIDNAYMEHLQKNRGLRDKLFITTLLSLNICLLIANILAAQFTKLEIGFRFGGIILLCMLFFLTKTIHKTKGIVWVFLLVFTYLLSFQKVDEMGPDSALTRSFSPFYAIMIVTLCSAISGFRFMHSLVLAIQITIFLIASIFIRGYLEINSVYEWFYVVLVLVRKYVFQKQSIINFRQGQKTTQISKQLNKIVSELLPKHAYEKLKTQNFQNRLQLTDLFEQCTILFADIKGFTQFSDKPQNKAEPTNVVKMLRSLFQEFDMLCTANNVYKVYTIGDCYVVLGFTNCYDRNPKKEAENVVNFGFDMIKMIQKVKREKPELSMLNMRIGVHTGTIIGGIVGTEIVRYDIYGSDVVVANKFEETGKIGKIHISQETKKLLDQLQKKPYSQRNIEEGQMVEIKKLNVSYKGYFIQRGNLS